MKIIKLLTYISLIMVFLCYGILIGKYEVFPYYYLKNFQDKYDKLIYNYYSEIKYTESENRFYEYSLETKYLPLSNKSLLSEKNINENIKNITKFIPSKTAFVVMDPWHFKDSKKEKLIIEKKIIPLINKALKKNHKVFILTVDPKIVKNKNQRVHEKLIKMTDKNLFLIYHENHNKEKLSEFLRSKDISSLIYLGFHSNACIINRELGIINMKLQGFKTFFIPEASAAIEDDGLDIFHNIATTMIKRYWAEEIDYDHIIGKLSSL